MITVNHLIHKYNENTILNDVSFSQDKGTVTAIIGPSGSGKTTLLRTLNALALAKSGTITIGDTSFDASKHNKKIYSNYVKNPQWFFKIIIFLKIKQY